jgi:hypothetical protein
VRDRDALRAVKFESPRLFAQQNAEALRIRFLTSPENDPSDFNSMARTEIRVKALWPSRRTASIAHEAIRFLLSLRKYFGREVAVSNWQRSLKRYSSRQPSRSKASSPAKG